MPKMAELNEYLFCEIKGDTMIRTCSTPDDLQAILQQSSEAPVFVMKHSTM